MSTFGNTARLAAAVERLEADNQRLRAALDLFYNAFLAEMDKVTIMADMPAAAVVGECTRAAKRAQMAVDRAALSDEGDTSE